MSVILEDVLDVQILRQKGLHGKESVQGGFRRLQSPRRVRISGVLLSDQEDSLCASFGSVVILGREVQFRL